MIKQTHVYLIVQYFSSTEYIFQGVFQGFFLRLPASRILGTRKVRIMQYVCSAD